MAERAVIRAPAKKTKKVPSKMCTRCGSIKPINQFYSNRAWAGQSFHDAWCIDCARAVAKDKEGLREYCWYNNRIFYEQVFEDCQSQAIYLLATDQSYLRATAEDKKKAMMAAQMVKCYFGRMNMKRYYTYVDNIKEEGPLETFNGESSAGMVKTDDDDSDYSDDVKTYSRKWNGTFSKREIDFLDGYFADLENDFVFSTASMRDYAKKVCKASLDADNAYNRYRSGNGSLDDYKKAMELFDKLSKAAEFAECERKAVTESNSFGEWAAKVEANNAIELDETPPFPEDWVDKVTSDFRHTLVACGLDGDTL